MSTSQSARNGSPGLAWRLSEPTPARPPGRARGVVHLGVGLAAAGILALLGHRILALVPLAIGSLAAILALVYPAGWAAVEDVLRRFGLGAGRLLGLLLIGSTMLLVFAPAGLFLRWRGKLRLAVRPEPGPRGYWRPVDRSAPSDYRRQF